MEDFTANASRISSSSASINKTPPPLPDRSKSVGDIIQVKKKVETQTPPAHDKERDPLGEHYAHLGKHVKEVRRRQQKTIASPKLSDFQVKKGDKILSTQWVEFIEAVIILFVQKRTRIINFFFFVIVDKIYRRFSCL